MTLAETNETAFIFSFTFPKRRVDFDLDKSEMHKSVKMKEFVSPKAYPCLSVNINQYVSFSDEKYLGSSNISRNKGKEGRGSFRTRNKFIMARNILCRLVKHERSLTSTEISKVVSIVWKDSCKSLQDYFEYLSILETQWYDHLLSSYGSSYLRGSQAIEKLNTLPYYQLCLSSYTQPPKRPKLVTTYPSSSKFKIQKIPNKNISSRNTSMFKNAHEKLSSMRNTFRIKKCSITHNCGIITEDMFFKSL